ncbi:hypothetical protein SSTU70S_01073 [Stutzerimonas stutzeri]
MSLDDIDFAERYRQHLRRSARPSKPPSAWDKRAAELAGKPLGGAYTDAFIRLMDLSGARSLLDIGCGPGTLCLPLAAQFERIYALDYSPGMLACLQARLDESGVDNVQPLQCAWEDDWSAVPVCDILIASRSGLVEDLDAALEKIHRHTRLRAYMTQLAGGHFIDPAIARLLGREQASVPDYIYTLNLLHQRGIHPRLDSSCPVAWPAAPLSRNSPSASPGRLVRSTTCSAKAWPAGTTPTRRAPARAARRCAGPSSAGRYRRPPPPNGGGQRGYSTVTDLARLRGWSTSVPRSTAT